MTANEILAEVQQEFGGRPRPTTFISGTCGCEECLEHDATMRGFDPENLPLDQLDNAGWDPMCFASDEAFAYFMPGLVRLVLEHTDDYLDQFLSHIETARRLSALSPSQVRVLMHVLDFLARPPDEAAEADWRTDDLDRAREKLAERARQDGVG